MAHAQQLEFVRTLKTAFPSYFTSSRTLEIGSLDITGTIRGFFDGGTYVGLDVAPGRGVDIVCQGQDYSVPDGSFDTVISCEAMEHNPHWKETMDNMVRVCRPGGLVVMTCATVGRREHGTTRTTPGDSPLSIGLGWEYYKNLTKRDFIQALPLQSHLAPLAFLTNWVSNDLYMAGFKRGSAGNAPPADAAQVLKTMNNDYRRINLRHASRSHYVLKRLLISLLGEEQYWKRPIRPW